LSFLLSFKVFNYLGEKLAENAFSPQEELWEASWKPAPPGAFSKPTIIAQKNTPVVAKQAVEGESSPFPHKEMNSILFYFLREVKEVCSACHARTAAAAIGIATGSQVVRL
jgi:hypothetical protein